MADAPRLPSGLRIYAIGDVHGRIDLLIELVAAIRRDNDARPPAEVVLVLVGDLIDRGPSSAEVVARCSALARCHDRLIVLKGNHEATLVDALDGSFPALAFWLRHGGDEALASWGVPADIVRREPARDHIAAAKAHIPSEAIAWLKALPLTYRRGNCLFVHAGLRPGIPLAKQAPVDLLWIREDFVNNTTPSPYVIIHGHTIVEAEPTLQHGRIGIDTGAYRTGRLTAVAIEGDRFWSFSASAAGPGTTSPQTAATLEENVDAILTAETASVPPSRPGRNKLILASAAGIALAVLATVGMVAREATRRRPPELTTLATRPAPRVPTPELGYPPPAAPPPTSTMAATGPTLGNVEKRSAAVGNPSSSSPALDGLSHRSVARVDVSPAATAPSSPATIARDGASTAGSGPPPTAMAVPSRALVPLPPRPTSTPTHNIASESASAAATNGAAPLIPGDRPADKISAEKARKRQEAIDAIRALRRQ